MPPKRNPLRKRLKVPQPNLPAALRKRLKGAKKVAVLAAGSDLRGDDAAGLLVAHHLKKLLVPARTPLRVFVGGTAPENLTGPIKKYRPTHLVVVDSAEFGGKSGDVTVMDLGEAVGGTTFSTHSLPLTVMLRYLQSFLECEVVILGIQPASLDFGSPVSKPVDRAARRVAAAIHRALSQASAR